MTSYWSYLKTKYVGYLTLIMGGLLTASGVWALGKHPEAPVALVVGLFFVLLSPILYLKLRKQEKKDSS